MAYPSTIPSFTTKINKNASGWYVGPEYFNVPTASPWEIYLDHVPMTSATTSIGASGGAAWTEVDDTPDSSHEYSVSYTTGKVTFYSGDSGAAVQATYYNLGDDVMAEHMNDVQDNIVITDNVLGINPAGAYSSVVDRLNAVDIAIVASGIDGDRIMDNTVRAGALKSDIKGSAWEAKGSKTLEDIYDHEEAATAHAASSITVSPPGTSTLDTVQEHIESSYGGAISDTTPHGITLQGLAYLADQEVYLNQRLTVTGAGIACTVLSASGSIVSIGSRTTGEDQYVYFASNNLPNQKWLRWAEASGTFEFNGPILHPWDSKFGTETQYLQIEKLDLGAGGVYPMIAPYSDGALSNVGAIANNLIIYDKANSGYPNLVFSNNTAGSLATVVYDIGNGKITYDTSIEISGDVLPGASGTYNVGTAATPFSEVYTETAHVVAGANGTFTTTDGKTVTVQGGIIISIV